MADLDSQSNSKKNQVQGTTTNADVAESLMHTFSQALKSHAQSMSSKLHYNMSRDIMPRQEIDIDFTR